ncbi:MAG: zinc-ribbon domain-containing protein [Nitrososphaeria archaeon]
MIYKNYIFYDIETSLMTKCPKCGYENPPEAKYCLNCGYKLVQEERERFEGSGLLLITSGTILIVTFLFNALLRVFSLLAIIYVIFGITSIYSGYRLYRGPSSLADLILASVSIIFGFSGTLFLYIIGLAFKGLVTPDWIIYLIATIKLLTDRKKLKNALKMGNVSHNK